MRTKPGRKNLLFDNFDGPENNHLNLTPLLKGVASWTHFKEVIGSILASAFIFSSEVKNSRSVSVSYRTKSPNGEKLSISKTTMGKNRIN